VAQLSLAEKCSENHAIETVVGVPDNAAYRSRPGYSPYGDTVLRVSWLITVLAALGPTIDFLLNPAIRFFGLTKVPGIVTAPLALTWFLLFVLATPVSILLAVAFVILAIRRGIPPKIKFATLVAMVLVFGAFQYWAELAKHGW